jgi:hydrogenase maturation factor
MKPLRTGKLPTAALSHLLDKIKITDEQVVLGPSIGEDAAVLRIGSKLVVAKTDPVTLASDLIGWYAVQVNANDIATRGVRPRWFLATLLLPEKSTHEEAEGIMDQILSACDSLGITLIGGHTEACYGLDRPVVVGCMLAEAEENAIITTAGARVGDDIVLTKGIAIEGTAVLARETGPALIAAGLSEELVQLAADYLFSPGISVVSEALTACSRAKPNCMHDPTEGGLATGLLEIASAAKVGVLVDEEKIPILGECEAICRKLNLDPLGLLASGSLIITVSTDKTQTLLEALNNTGIYASAIGKLTEPGNGVKIRTLSGIQDLPQFERDELARYFDNLDSA